MPRSAANTQVSTAVHARCAGCGLEADARYTAAECWAWWIPGDGDLVPYCPACAEREFGHRTTLLASRS